MKQKVEGIPAFMTNGMKWLVEGKACGKTFTSEEWNQGNKLKD
jgi:hypothetical protein